MTAALGGLAAAFVWSLGNLFAARSAHQLGAASTLAWIMLVGLGVLAVAIALGGSVPALSADTVAWLTLAGVGNAGTRKGPRGDVHVLFEVAEDPRFASSALALNGSRPSALASQSGRT